MPCTSIARLTYLGIGLIWCGLTQPLCAQDFRLYTSVTDLANAENAKPHVSLTLFHAGKVYDYIESAEETVIYEPAHSRFLILNKRHDLATEITQDEIRRYLNLAGTQARQLIADWQREGTTPLAEIQLLEFQLLPEFTLSVNEKFKKLSLSSPLVRYDVIYANAPSPELALAYLKSADWTAQLNAVLHPQSLLPGARLQLNDELRDRKVIPLEVELQIKGEHPIHLKAKHAWTWNLYPTDRKLIDLRESQLRQADFRTIPFGDFQREILTSAVRRK